MKNILIEWRHFDKDGKTCERCSGTGANIVAALGKLRVDLDSKDIKIDFKETKLPQSQMKESNEIWIDGILLENLIPNAVSGENDCDSCSDLIGSSSECRCRTVRHNDEILEEIPAELIRQAVLNRINNN